MKIYNILVGGKAGEGVKKAAQVLANTVSLCGKNVFQNDDYQSLIKGGHNFSLLTVSEDAVRNSYRLQDLMISFDNRSLLTHKDSLQKGGLHFVNMDDCKDLDDSMIPLPLTSMMKEVYSQPSNVSLAVMGIFFALTGLSEDYLLDRVEKEYRHNVEENKNYALRLYNLISELGLSCDLRLNPTMENKSRLYTGNQLIALGAWAAGLDYYYSYPMTPASSILHYLALKRDSHGVYAIHTESELAAANMAIGSILAGKKAAVGSSGGGFALMQEAFSLAGMAEAPLLCILSSRPGPATGVSTYTAQEDLFFALNQGHGSFPRIVATPDSHERAFSLAGELLDLAWESQSPAILLTEKHLSEATTNLSLKNVAFPAEIELPAPASEPYQRYEFTDSGVSPLKFPGSGHATAEDVIKWNSHEHIESGVRTDNAEEIVAMKAKRQKKADLIRQAVKRYENVAEYGEGDALVFAYGSTAMELREAQKYLPFRLVVPIYLEPFPFAELEKYRGRAIIVVEHSCRADFAEFLRQKLDIKATSILKYDGRHFDTFALVEALKEVIDA